MKNSTPKIHAKRNPLAAMFFDWSFKKLLERNFQGIWVKNRHNFYLRDNNCSNLVYGLHSCWWDGILASFICRNLYNCSFYMMIKDLYRFPVLSFVGGFSVDKQSSRGAYAAINHSINLLKNPENTLWIFPQGQITPPDYRPIIFESGLAHICKKLDGLNLIPIAYRYVFSRKEKPEIYVEIGKPIIIKGGITSKKDFLFFVQEEFAKLVESQALQLASGDCTGYECVLNNDNTWIKILEDQFKPLWRVRF